MMQISHRSQGVLHRATQRHSKTLQSRTISLRRPLQGNQGNRIRSNSNDEVDESNTLPNPSPVSPTTISLLREKVFSLDTFFVTSVDNYGENGVLFKGNIRGNPSEIQKTLQRRLDDEVGGYKLFLLQDRDDKPVSVILPSSSAEFQVSPAAEWALSIALGMVTLATTLNISNAQLFNLALLEFKFEPEQILAALPSTIATIIILGAHELGHSIAAKKEGISLAPPLFLPAGLGLLGTFGSITRVTSDVQNRETLAKVISPGPIAGTIVSFAFVLVGLALTSTGTMGGVELDTASFRESFLVGGLARAAFGDNVFTAESVDCNPLLVAGWAGLIINSINLIPCGELDGGKLSLAAFGRQGSQLVSVISFIALGIGSFVNGLALFWLLLVLTIQRGPGVPCQEEISGLNQGLKIRSILLLAVPLMVLLPFPLIEDNTMSSLAPF